MAHFPYIVGGITRYKLVINLILIYILGKHNIRDTLFSINQKTTSLNEDIFQLPLEIVENPSIVVNKLQVFIEG